MDSWFVVGVSGVSCGGKTTLTKKLVEKLPFPVVVFYQDDYFFPEESDKHVYIEELNHANWDILSSLDLDTLYENVKAAQNIPPPSTPGILLIDGNLILNFRPIEQICHKKIYITLDKSSCWTRRKVRVYQPPDTPGYFEKCVWPMYEMYKKEIDETIQDVVYIDGTTEMDQIFSQVFDVIISSVVSNVETH